MANTVLTLIPPIHVLFCHENVVCFLRLHFRQDFIMEANTVSPDQTALLGAV